MPILPVRQLGALGVVRDTSPYDLPPNGWSACNNVRFSNGRVLRAPVFRELHGDIQLGDLGSCEGIERPDGSPAVIIASADGRVHSWAGDVTDVLQATARPVSSLPMQAFTLGHVLYVNRGDRPPLSMIPSASVLTDCPAWPSATTSARVLRPFGDRLIALNMLEDGDERPMRIRWSDPAPIHLEPATWDAAATTGTAGFNDLSRVRTAILDGLQLGSQFIVYASDCVVRVSHIGGPFVFRFDDLWSDDGIIATNAVAEMDGRHYVFGTRSIYMHDGVSRVNIARGRVQRFVFDHLDFTMRHRCHVFADSIRREVLFCYISGDNDVSFRDTAFANKAAVYNVDEGTWSFRDLPNVAAFSTVILGVSRSWAAAGNSWEDQGGTFASQGGTTTPCVVCVSSASPDAGLTSCNLFGVDNSGIGSILGTAVAHETVTDAWVMREGIDFDETGVSLDTVKMLKSVYPQVNLPTSDIEIAVGASDYPQPLTTQWNPPCIISQAGSYRIDSIATGRYIGIRVCMPGTSDFELSGMDLDLEILGRA